MALERQKLEPVLTVNVEETFPKGIIFMKAEDKMEYDREAKKQTTNVEGIRVHCVDRATKEPFQVVVPVGTISRDQNELADYEFQPVQFENLTAKPKFNSFGEYTFAADKPIFE